MAVRKLPIPYGTPCPQAEGHTPVPSGYNQWHGWAARMKVTHKQVRCPGCGLFKIWVPR